MEKINLGAFVLVLALAGILVAQVLRAGRVSAWDGFLVSGLAQRARCFADRVRRAGLLGLRHGLFRDDERIRCSTRTCSDCQCKLRKYYTLTPLFVFAMLMVAVANNLGVMWVAMEATTLTTVFLITFYGRATSLEAAWKYTMIGGVGLSMALFGTILTYYAAETCSERTRSPV